MALGIVVWANLDLLAKSNDQLLADQARAVASLAAEQAWNAYQRSDQDFTREVERLKQADPRILWVRVLATADPEPAEQPMEVVQTVTISNQGDGVVPAVTARVAIALDRSSLVVTRNSALIRSIGIAVLEIIASIAFSLWLANWLLGRLSNLQNASQKIAEGDFSQRVAVSGNDEISDTAAAFNTMAGRLSTLMNRVRDESTRRESIEAELRVARQIQDSLHPAPCPEFPNNTKIEVEAVDDPVREVAGDFYDWFAIDDRHLALVIADVVGKGLAAGLFAAACLTVVRTLARTGLAPAEVLARANTQLAEQNRHQMFASVVLLHLDVESGQIEGAIAGHPAGRILHSDGTVERVLERTGPILGVIPNASWSETSCHLAEGDRLILVTDGVLEARNESGEMLDDDGFDAMLKSIGDVNAAQTARRITWAVRTREGETPQDDVTVVVVRRIADETSDANPSTS